MIPAVTVELRLKGFPTAKTHSAAGPMVLVVAVVLTVEAEPELVVAVVAVSTFHSGEPSQAQLQSPMSSVQAEPVAALASALVEL